MTLQALIFGSIGTLADTSDMQRRAFNAAFEEHDLGWTWDEEEYKALLKKPGGQKRVEDYAAARDQDVDAMSVHASKVKHFSHLVDEEGIRPRPGVLELISNAKSAGAKLGFATTTTPETLTLLFSGLFPDLPRSVFNYIGSNEEVAEGKPAPDIYLACLKALDVDASKALAIEDTPEAAQAAVAAGITTLGFANDFASGRSFPDGVDTVEILPVDLFSEKAPAA